MFSCAAGIIAFFILPSSQKDAIFLTEKERIVAVWRVSANKWGIKNEKILVYQIHEAFTDIKLYLVAVLAISLGILNGSVSNFLSALLAGFGYNSLKVLLYQLPSGAFQFVATVTGGLANTYFSGLLCFTMALACLPGLAGMIGIATISIQHQLALTACAWLPSIGGLAIILSWTLVATNFAGHTKRTTANGVLFVFYAAGNIIGPFLFFPDQKPRYLTAIKILATLYGVSALMAILLYILMLLENRKRDGMPNIPEEVGLEEGFHDHTDKENLAFRYKL